MAAPKKSLLSLGSNLGKRKKQLDAAVDKIQQTAGISAVRVSRYRESTPVGGRKNQELFLNAVVEVSTTLTAESLLVNLQRIESELGRERHVRWDPRTIDIDILAFEDVVISSSKLTLPHPRITLRRFVLEPVCDLAGHQMHPETGWSYQSHLDHLEQAGNYALTMNLTDQSALNTLLELECSDSTFVTQSLPVAQTEARLAATFDLLKPWSASSSFVLCNFAPRQCLLERKSFIDTIERHEKTILPPRLLVILTDNIHNESRHQMLRKLMPNGIVTPWLFLDISDEDVLLQEFSAFATCHL